MNNPMRILLPIVALAALSLAAALQPATSQETAPKENRGVKIESLASIDLGSEIDGMQGRQLRLRMLTIEPGGVIGLHSHKDRPAVVRIVQGTITEHLQGGAVSDHHEGESRAEGKEVTHWSENKGSKPAIVIVSDIFKP